jgi:sulfatase maturation enzyme AslB (radical SAM superfamily)
MGWHVTLTLHGIATFSRGFSASETSSVVRLRSQLNSKEKATTDFVIVRSREELQRAVDARIDGVMLISDGRVESLPEVAELPHLIGVSEKFDYLSDGDIIGFHPTSKRFRTLYRRISGHNSFLVTDRCNHYCLMCSQPPKDIDDRWILGEIRAALPIIDKDTRPLGFTGGEPLLDWREFIDVLATCRDELPKTAIHVLSNGRAFVHDEVVAAWTGIRHPNLTVGIPIYAAVDYIHDHVVQAGGAFDETVLGVLKLKDKGQRVEIRVVLHTLTAPRIVERANGLPAICPSLIM